MRSASRWLCLFVLFCASPAYADSEGWLIVESRLPVFETAAHEHRLSLRLLIDFRVAERSRGVQQALARFGIVWEPWWWLLIAGQTNANMQSNDGVTYGQEWRQEFEAQAALPISRWLMLAHRHRFELRWVNRLFAVRHRILTRVNFTVTQPVHPFVFNEIFLVGAPEFVNQHRVVAGITWRARRNLHVEAGYVYRLRSTGPASWAHDHGPRIAITFIPSYEGEIVVDGGSE